MTRRFDVPAKSEIQSQVASSLEIVLRVDCVVVLGPAGVMRGHGERFLVWLSQQKARKRIPGEAGIGIRGDRSERSLPAVENVVRRRRARTFHRILIGSPVETKLERMAAARQGNTIGYDEGVGNLKAVGVISKLAVADRVLAAVELKDRKRLSACTRDAQSLRPVLTSVARRLACRVHPIEADGQVIQYRRSSQVVPAETEIVGVVVVVVIVGRNGRGQIEGTAVKKVLLTAVIAKEKFVLLGEVLVNAEASLGRDHVIQNRRIEEIVNKSRNAIGGRTRPVGGRQKTLDR